LLVEIPSQSWSILLLMNLCLLMSSLPGNTWNDVSVTEEQLRTDHGGAVRMSVHVPSGGGRLPAIVVAPGRGYHRGLPIPVRLCELAAERGLVAVRFDWAYTDAKSAPSAGLVNELVEMQAVVDWLRRHPRVDGSQILITGKSLGSIVAWRLAQRDPEILGVALLTPVIPERDGGARYYSGLTMEKRPVAILVGSNDPQNCPIPNLYYAVKDASSNVSVLVVPGDHGLEVADALTSDGSPQNCDNIEAAMRVLVEWARSAARGGRPVTT
jgi:dienelactone hydrolase